MKILELGKTEFCSVKKREFHSDINVGVFLLTWINFTPSMDK